jgi:hypothetical protein
VSSKYRYLYQFCYVKIFSTDYNINLLLLDDPGRLRSQITSVVCQIQRFDFECNLVLTRKLIIRIPAGLGLNPLYTIRRSSERFHDFGILGISGRETLHSNFSRNARPGTGSSTTLRPGPSVRSNFLAAWIVGLGPRELAQGPEKLRPDCTRIRLRS